MQMQDPAGVYRKEIEKHRQALQKLLAKRSRLGWIRLFVFIATIAIAYQVFVSTGLAGLIVVAAGLALLLFLVSLDVNNNRKIANTKTLIRINEEELEILSHRYHHRFDGSGYMPEVHSYANDLDLFGKASLFQWINRCHSEQGRYLLAQNLLQPLDIETVRLRQEAVSELAADTGWRQQLQAFAMETAITVKTETRARAWLDEEHRQFSGRGWSIFVLTYSCITLASVLAAILGYIPAGIFSFLFAVYFTIATVLSRNTIRPYLQLSGIVKEIDTLRQLVSWIEGKSFSSPLLKKLCEDARPANGSAAAEIGQLKAILDRFDLRLSILGMLFFNSFLLWDVRQMIALNSWRHKNKALLPHWFRLIAEIEVLGSLSTLRFNEPGWCWPGWSQDTFLLVAGQAGHPLIQAEKRVLNDFRLQGEPGIAIITGSNMAGKSTFLRCLGVNMVLARTGAPVCANSLLLPPVDLMSSMRIADNLAENTSTFYAELKKLKTIIEAVNSRRPVFILLDEILRGTNSLDRHTGSAALIRQLIQQKAVAVIATHDVELAALQQEFGTALENYHFDVQVEGEELYFDYRLKPGVCKSLNASILMKKIGIRLNEA
ncbi:MAG TPA: hypothetical protein VFR58_09600 [Flavisolibacter sp.]|nr:hypothetical protein [Flavisolibacter sp.]